MTIARLIESQDPEIVSCDADTPVRDAIALLAERRFGALPVMDDDVVVGIFSERDVIYRLHGEGAAVLDRPVGEVMTAPVLTVSPDIDVIAALALMTKRRFRHLPVVEDGKMLGFISIGDLVKFRIDRIESEAAAMRDYIQMA